MKTFKGFLGFGIAAAFATATFLPALTIAQDTTTTVVSSNKAEQWIHVRVESKEDHGETVRVNVPVEMAAKVLPAINKDNFRDGKVRIDSGHTDGRGSAGDPGCGADFTRRRVCDGAGA